MEKPASPIIIQSSQIPGGQNFLPKGNLSFSLPKIVFIALSLIIVGELVWGAWYVLKPSSTSIIPFKNKQTVTVKPQASAKISLVASQKEVKVGDNLSVDVMISSNNNPTVGTDLIIKYDPNLLSLSKTSFTKGTVYQEYLGQSLDDSKGVFRISGLSTATSKNSVDGKFGTLNFNALAAGRAQVTIDFKPGSSTDSNVIDAKLSKDILDRVDNLEVNIK